MDSVRRYTTELLARTWLSENTCELRFSLPPDFSFTPGQYIRFEDHPSKRDYSITTTPGDPVIELCVKNRRSGGFSSVLASAEPGTPFLFSGPHGYFIHRPSLRPAVFVATGTGIAPFVSMTRSGIAGFILLHGVAADGDLYYEHLFSKMARSYIPCISRAPDSTRVHAFIGKVTEYMEYHLDKKPYDFYLSGKRDMIRDVTYLVDDHFEDSRVYTEIFD